MFRSDPRLQTLDFFTTSLLDECYRVLISLVRVQIPGEVIKWHGWLRLTVLHGLASYPVWNALYHSRTVPDIAPNWPVGLFYGSVLFIFVRLWDLATRFGKYADAGSGFYYGKPALPPVLWNYISPKAWWWVETLAFGGFLVYWISPESNETIKPLFDSNNIALIILGVGFVWRCLKEKLGFSLGQSTPMQDSHGNAVWGSEQSIEAAGLREKQGLVIGYFKGKPLRVSGEGNLLTAAPSGAGKGTCTVIPNLLEYTGPMIVTDLKGENYLITARRRAQMGHRVVRLDAFGVCGGNADSFNPLDTIPRNDPHANDRAIEIAEMLVLPNPNTNDPHWDERARDFIRIFLLYILCEIQSARRHLGTLRWIVTQPENDLEVIYRVMANCTGAGGLIARGAAMIKSIPRDERASIFSCIHRHTSFLDSSAAVASLEKTTFNPEELVTSGRVSVYLVLPHNKIVAYNRLFRLWIGSLIGVITRHGVAPRGRPLICFMLDEMAQLGRTEAIVSAVTLLRGYGATIWSIVQDINQLKTLYPNNEWNTIISNSRYRMFSCVSENDTAEYLSKALGDQTYVYTTDTVGQSDSYSSGSNGNSSDGMNGSSSGWGWNRNSQKGRSASTSTHHVARKLLALDEVMKLPRHKQIILLQGTDPVLSDKVDYFSDLRLAKLAK